MARKIPCKNYDDLDRQAQIEVEERMYKDQIKWAHSHARDSRLLKSKEKVDEEVERLELS